MSVHSCVQMGSRDASWPPPPTPSGVSTQVRAAFGHVASGVEALQPGAEAAVVAHLEASAWDAYFPGLVAKLPLPPGEAAPLVAVGGPEPTAFKDVGGEPGEGPWSEPPLAFSVLRRGLAAAGLGRAQLAPGLQSCITLATAFLLVVVKSAYLALGSKSYWVIYTGGWGGWLLLEGRLVGCCDLCPRLRPQRWEREAKLHLCGLGAQSAR